MNRGEPNALRESQQQYREGLVPPWIKFLCLLFLFAPLMAPVVYLSTLMDGGDIVEVRFLGFHHTGQITDIGSLMIHGLAVCFSISAYGILNGSAWGLRSGVACIIFTLAVTSSQALASLVETGRVNIPIEGVAAIALLVWLRRVWSSWENPPLHATGCDEHEPRPISA